jgi:hypothetical protein
MPDDAPAVSDQRYLSSGADLSDERPRKSASKSFTASRASRRPHEVIRRRYQKGDVSVEFALTEASLIVLVQILVNVASHEVQRLSRLTPHRRGQWRCLLSSCVG